MQEVYAGARHHRCERAWVVAPAGYTRAARELARSTGVSLFDADTVRGWIRHVDRLEKERERAAGGRASEDRLEEARKRASWHPHPDDPT